MFLVCLLLFVNIYVFVRFFFFYRGFFDFLGFLRLLCVVCFVLHVFAFVTSTYQPESRVFLC